MIVGKGHRTAGGRQVSVTLQYLRIRADVYVIDGEVTAQRCIKRRQPCRID
ncbi:hypothetical protein [Stenotrophomonas sp. CFBP8980]|uniref:hypothetical protein n=1 Tax=Stenotrophomonas sp. CFBP8980 TaxID=3096523 RepID=UPI002A69CA57|nr:hypothetical protein [Stenotrophomonas sp. CFBP8980]